MVDALNYSPAYSRYSTPSPAPTTSMFSLASDQPLSAGNLSQTSSREPRRSARNRNTGVTASPLPLPEVSHKSPRPCPAREDDRPRTISLHPDLATIEWDESSLTKKGELFSNGHAIGAYNFIPEFEAVRTKIQTDPDYLGELPFIQLLNPQYKVNKLIPSIPKSSSGKWYNVSKGTAIGIFNNW